LQKLFYISNWFSAFQIPGFLSSVGILPTPAIEENMRERDYTVPAVAKALDILEYVGLHENTMLRDIVSDLGLPKTSAYQLTQTLLRRGYLRNTRVPGGYSLGMRLFALGNQAVGQIDIRSEAMPLLYELMRSVQQTCHLGVLEGNEAMYLAKVDSPHSLAVGSWVGKRFNLQTTAMGKVLVAWRDPQEVRTLLLSNPPPSPTEHTIIDVDEYLARLAGVRIHGWAMDDRENVIHIRCLAAPVFGARGSVVGAISITASANEITPETIPGFTEKLLSVAANLSEKIGYRATPRGK
jgi:DNA-binding IclR family transcriptional regulator